MKKNYNEPEFMVISSKTEDVLTMSTESSGSSGGSSGITPGHYDTPIIPI